MALWIEIYMQQDVRQMQKSRLMWPCGLKWVNPFGPPSASMSRLMWPCGLKSDDIQSASEALNVEAYVALWIEIV